MVRPSGPLAPNVEQKRPTLETLPSFMNGIRHTALSRVIATNSTLSLGSSTSPLGLMPLSIRQSSRPPAVEPVDPPGRIVQPGLALVGEIDVAVGSEMQIVAALEGLRVARGQDRQHPPRFGIELHDAVPVIGNQDAPVGIDLESVGPAVIFDDQRSISCQAIS